MKTNQVVLCFCAVVLAAIQPAAGTVTFTLTPAAVSNTYSGQITLQVAGLTSGGTVVVQKFLDLNTNGVIDASDWLVQQFSMTDGQAGMVIGGINNSNVPGDTDTTAGQITAKFNFRNGDFIQNIAGKFLYKISGNFTPPLTNVFTVTNFPWPQKITGNVVSNGTSTTLSNAVVLLMPGTHNSPVAGTVANNAGSYTIPVPAGTYLPVVARSNYACNFSTPPVIALGSGATVTTNLSLTNATASISGKVVDANNPAIGLPGVMVPAQSPNGLIAVTFTDTNGNFNLPVPIGTWGVKADDTSLIVHGYLGLQNRSNVVAGTTGITITVPKANALVYGSVKDNVGNPLPALDEYADDQNNNLYETDGYTDANGNYFLGVMSLGSSDPWWVEANNDSQLTNYIFSQPNFGSNNGTNISANTAAQINFTGIAANNQITGTVKDSNNNPIVGVGVSANAAINGTSYQNYTHTLANGTYSLNLANGSWSVSLYCSGNYSDCLDTILGSGKYTCPNGQTATIANSNVTNNFTVQLCGGIAILTPSTLPVGEVNVYYDQFLQASSCNGGFTWALLAGTPPPGLNANLSTGEIYGVPTSAGNYTVGFQVTDGNGLTTNKQISISMSNALQLTTSVLPNGTNGSTYSQVLQATAGVPFGGAAPYSWSVASGSLPANLTLATNGLLYGMAATNGTFNFTAQVTDALGGSSSQALALNLVSTNNYPPLMVGTGGGQILVYWPLAAGTNYTVQMTTNLATGPWVSATNGLPVAAFTFTNQAPAVFFRLH